jgi:hypothetical protein
MGPLFRSCDLPPPQRKPWLLSRYTDGLGTACSGFDSWQRYELFRMPQHSDLPWSPFSIKFNWFGTQAFSPGLKRSQSEADHSFPSNAGVKNNGAVPPIAPICVHVMMLNQLNREMILSFIIIIALRPFVGPWSLFSFLFLYTGSVIEMSSFYGAQLSDFSPFTCGRKQISSVNVVFLPPGTPDDGKSPKPQ